MSKILPIPGNPKVIGSSFPAHGEKNSSVCYDINVTLHPTEAIILSVPETYQSMVLDLITLSHRKAHPTRSKDWDPEPSYSRILVFDKKTRAWLYWGVNKFPAVSFGDKLAESRDADNPEIEALHDWVAYSGIIYPQAVCIINSGNGAGASSFIHSLIVDFFPKDTSVKQLWIFSPGTVFADPKKNSNELFGGGESYKGQYPYAVAINLLKTPSFPLSEKGDSYYLQNSQLHIVVDREYTFSRIEVAVGDTKDTGEFNKDGHIGSLGGAKLDIMLIRKNKKQYLAQNLNVPPQGVLKASPRKRLTVLPGDKFIISAERDPAYVMGVRIQ